MTSIATKIFAIFTLVGEWLGTAIPSFSNIFWDATNSELTVMGTCAILSLGVSISFLCIGIFTKFLRFK